ncbi:MAG TPA: hypothetical protein VFO73_08360 [Candidatus Limnocylindrales bacterium]|nr:hypothetical protein [Candidatus Limnocylindrales bacterium]
MAGNDTKQPHGDEELGRMMREAAEGAHHRLLDDPRSPGQPSAARHLAYFVLVVGGGAALNLAVLALLAR